MASVPCPVGRTFTMENISEGPGVGAILPLPLPKRLFGWEDTTLCAAAAAAGESNEVMKQREDWHYTGAKVEC